jgi:O-antigen ligase
MATATANTWGERSIISASKPAPLLARVETYFLLVALFLLATNGTFLTPGQMQHAESLGTITGPGEPTGPLHLSELAIAFAISTPLTLSRWRSVLRLSLRMKLFSAISLLAILSSLWSRSPQLSFRCGLYLLLNTTFCYYLLQRFTMQQLMRLMMLLGCIIFVLSGILAVALPAYAWTKAGGEHMGLQGVFIAKNLMGNVAVLLLTPALFVRGMRPGVRGAYMLMMLLLVVLSFSAQAWVISVLCFGFAFVCGLFRRFRQRDNLWIAYVSVLPALAALGLLFTNWTDVLEILGKDPTLSGRTTIWAAVLKPIFRQPWLGWGYNAFWLGFKGESAAVAIDIHFPISQSQNGILEILLTLGVAGAVLVLATFAQSFRDFVRCVRRRAADGVDWYLLIILITIIYAIGEADLLLFNSLTWMLYMLACCGLLLESRRAAPSIEPSRRPQSSPIEH